MLIYAGSPPGLAESLNQPIAVAAQKGWFGMLSIPEMYDYVVECINDGNIRGAWMYIDDMIIRGLRLSTIFNNIFKLSPDAYARLMPLHVAA